MNSYRKNAIIAGILFIIGTFAPIISAVLTMNIINDSDYLIKISANENPILIGILLLIVAEVAYVGIAISLYPILRKFNKGLALGAVVFRSIEGVLGIVGVVGSLVLLMTLSQEFVKAGAPVSPYFQTIGELLKAGRAWMRDVPMLLTWCIGAQMYYLIFFQSKLIPRCLSVWGIVSVTLTILGSMLVMFRLVISFGLIQLFMNVPVLFQEMVLAVWLIVKGFNPSAIATLSSKKI